MPGSSVYFRLLKEDLFITQLPFSLIFFSVSFAYVGLVFIGEEWEQAIFSDNNKKSMHVLYLSTSGLNWLLIALLWIHYALVESSSKKHRWALSCYSTSPKPSYTHQACAGPSDPADTCITDTSICRPWSGVLISFTQYILRPCPRPPGSKYQDL